MIEEYASWHLPDGSLRDGVMLRGLISEEVLRFRPNWVLFPSPFDYHRDHVVLSNAVEAVLNRVTFVELKLRYETWAPCPATHVVEITSTVSNKWNALMMHQTALQYGDYLRAAQGLAQYRGLYLGRDRYAEAFWVSGVGQSEKGFNSELIVFD